LGREYYILKNEICHYITAPPVIDMKLKIHDNSSFKGSVDVGNVKCSLYVFESINERIEYYVTVELTWPVKIVVTAGSTVTTINFKVFKAQIPDNSAFEVSKFLKCLPFAVGGKTIQSREDFMNYLDFKPGVFQQPENIGEALPKSGIDPAILTLIGKAAWAIINENKPDSNVQNVQNAVVPQGTSWNDLNGWRQQKWPGWQWTIVNAYGANCVDYRWAFNYLCAGKYGNVGSYIENAAAFPDIINVLWGYTVNVRGQVLNPFNYGSATAPVAGLTLTMTMDTSTLIKKITQTCTVNLIGNCNTQLVTCNGYKSTPKFRYN